MATIDIIIQAIDKASKDFDKISKSAQRMGKQMEETGKSLTKNLTLPIVAAGAVMVKAFSDFDTQLTNFEARTGSTAEEMEMVRQKALELGRDTAFSASQAAEGMLELAASGSTVEETMVAITPVLNLASAGMLELGAASDAVTDILAAYQLEVEDAVDVTDILAGASQKSSASIADLIDGFANVGPVAQNFGVSVQETAAALAVFSENGIKGSEAGTQLRSMLNNMSRDTARTQGAWNRLGTSMFDAQGAMLPLDDIIDNINKGMEGMTEQERITTIQDLAGTYGQMGLSALLASDGIDTMQASMREAQTAQEVAEKQLESFAGAVSQLKSSFETMSIQVIGPFVEEVLQPMIQMVTGAINAYADWASQNQTLSNAIVGVAVALAALGPSLIIVGKMIALFGMVKNAILAIKAAMAALNLVALMNPWTLAIMAVAAAIAFAVKNWDDFKRGVQLVWEIMKEFFEFVLKGGVGGALIRALGLDNAFIDGIKKAVDVFHQFRIKFHEGIAAWKQLIPQLFELGQALIVGFGKGMLSGLKAIDDALGGVGQKVIGGVKDMFQIFSPSRVMQDLGTQVSGGLGKGIEDGWKAIGGLQPLTQSVTKQINTMSNVAGNAAPVAGGGAIAANGLNPAFATAQSGVVIQGNTFVLPEGTIQEQADAIMKIIAKKIQKQRGLSGRSLTT